MRQRFDVQYAAEFPDSDEPVLPIGADPCQGIVVRSDSLDETLRTVIGQQHHTRLADNGDIVVALVDEEEATLKRLRRKGASVALEAANPVYETRIFGPDRVRIQGKLVGLIRRY